MDLDMSRCHDGVMTQDPNMMYESLYGPYHVHTWYIHLYALKGL